MRVVDLFAGCGALTLGVAEAARRVGLGIDVRLAVDIDEAAAAVYRVNLPEADVRCADIRSVFDGELSRPLTKVETSLRDQVGEIDVLVAGPPCQGHSDLNNHTRRADPRNQLYARAARAAEVLEPTIVLIENVPTVKHDVGNVVQATVGALKSIGYAVASAIIDISRLGGPQRRRRHVVLASNDMRVDVEQILSRPCPRCPDDHVRTVRWAIRDIVNSKPVGLFDSSSVPNDDNAKRIAWLFKHRRYDLPNSLRPECHKSDHSYRSMYGRLRWNEPSQTITTGFGSMGQGRYVHPSRRRTITPHEAARLQLIPDFWDFSSARNRGSLAELIGNAVPPTLASALLEPALRSLAMASVRSVQPRPISPRVDERSSTQHGTRPHAPNRSGRPKPSSVEARKRMQSVRQSGTAAELALRAEVDRFGMSYEPNATLPGMRRRADLLFRQSRVAVMVDGCYWHACPIHGTSAKANARWWREKLQANQRRDRDTDALLHQNGWIVLRFWEHENPRRAAVAVASVVSERTLRAAVAARTTTNRRSRRRG